MRPPVPAVEVADHPGGAGVRRPDREAGAAHLAHRPGEAAHVGAEHLPQLLVPALADQMQVHLARAGKEAVRLVDRAGAEAVVADLDPVVGDVRPGHDGAPDAVPLVRHRPGAAVGQQHADRGGERAQRAHGHRAGMRVRAEHAVRVVVGAGGHPGQGVRVHRPQSWRQAGGGGTGRLLVGGHVRLRRRVRAGLCRRSAAALVASHAGSLPRGVPARQRPTRAPRPGPRHPLRRRGCSGRVRAP